MQLKKKTKTFGVNAGIKKLSIQFNLDGFSFYISNSDSDTPILYTEYSFPVSIATPELLLEKIIAIFSEDKDLQQNFTSVMAIHQNNLFTMVPEELFDRNSLQNYLKYTVKTLATDYITYDFISPLQVNTVYIPYVNINNYIFQNFGEFEYHHHITVLINKLQKQKEASKEVPTVYVNVSKKELDIIIFKNNTLRFSNSFTYQTKEDFIYYILFVAEQLHLNPEEFHLYFMGKIEPNSALYEITYTFVRNVDFIQNTKVNFNENDPFSAHSNFILLA
ncbi:DUF3822 family protein [Tenacibaculum sp. SG-28]|uniref:DUF3822 family protein n=1 Tax=Tenacibaculum sp. SG-28 TaxID=754426 RepID=UPI000CF48BC4|nr:DUF3822 family protein [Tenacibaculum sp. SG-28]PQJ23173.1 hypothetical protein BSU00_02785 [Tenacibaculum sp. SG-28]